MIKRFLQKWLGIKELSDMIALQRGKQADSILSSDILRDRIVEADDPSDMWLDTSETAKPAIVRGYDRPEPTDTK